MKISIEHEDPQLVGRVLSAISDALYVESGEEQRQGNILASQEGAYSYPGVQMQTVQSSSPGVQTQVLPLAGGQQTAAPATEPKKRDRRTKAQIEADNAAKAAGTTAPPSGIPALAPVPDIAAPAQYDPSQFHQPVPNYGAAPAVQQFDPAAAALYQPQVQQPAPYAPPVQNIPPPAVPQAPASDFIGHISALINQKVQEQKGGLIGPALAAFTGQDGQPLQRVTVARPEDYPAIAYVLQNL